MTGIILYSASIFSGNEVGNGGDIIQCKDSIQLLDFYEAKEYDFIVPQEKKYEDYKKILSDILDNFSKLDKKLALQYKNRMNEIESKIDFRSSITLTDISDSNHEMLPKNCQLHQIAIRRKEEKREKLFLINKDLWDQLNSINKAGLILHEIIYEHFLYLGEKDSKKARLMNALIFHNGTKTLLPDIYKKMLQSNQIPIYR